MNYENFLAKIQNYINENNLPYSIKLSTKNFQKTLIVINDSGQETQLKIDKIKTMAPSGMCHSNSFFTTINPDLQPELWFETKISTIAKATTKIKPR